VEGAMKRPEDVTLSREEGEALITRLERDALTAEDRRMLVKVLTFYFWLLFALREAKLSLKRLKALVFGEKPKKREPPPSGQWRAVKLPPVCHTWRSASDKPPTVCGA
jgi:hypothetical protein